MIDQNSQFFAILTAVGEAKQANATALGQPWTFSQMGVGDANLTDPIPNRTQTRLINEWRRAPVNQVRTDPANPNIIITEQVIPADVGGKWIREIGLYDADGDMVAVANCAPSFKPLLVQGTGKTQIIRMNFIVANTASVVLKIDPAVVLATREWVDLQIIEALAKLDYKHSVLVATTANIVLSGIQTVDGVLLPADSRVLVKDQTQAKDNGIYVVPPGGAWKRAQDADASVEVTPGLFVSVEKGTANGDSVWQLVTDAPIVLGTTPLTFEVVAGRTGIGAGTYRSVTVDKLGRVIAGTNPTTLAGAGITDAMPIGAGRLMTSAPLATGKISELPNTQFFMGTAGNTTDLPAGVNYAVGMHIKYPGPVNRYAFDFISSVTEENFAVRGTYADGPGAYRTLWHTGNFDPASKMPTVGGAYRPTFNSVGISATAGGLINLQGGYIGWNESGLGEMHFVCNGGTGNGGFSWRSVNHDNTQTGPAMSYSYSGILSVPTALFVPAITSNTTVSTQSPGYAGGFIANCAYVVAAVQYKIGGNNCFEAGFIGGDVAAPYMKNVNGTVVRLQVDRPKDTALLASNGWSKNADTGEIIQWLEYSLGDFAQTTLINVTWPFRFPNQFLNARVSFKLAANAQCGTQGSYSLATVDGCTLRIEEWAGVVQTGLVVVVEARGF
ncbi:phage tail protein [Pseudomonas fluorescens]|uniref:phage tail protein n=1 Tax=Pseudomonas fluorescens TaxID=294 RepID=UPI00313C2BE8